ncbi:DinB family protein [Winogradskyella sp. R77965]|uniref:DinB family protein n=1 Tax=Winogradskyella sp. R77965 TaxID=3093872 RepID=UPI0037DDB19F
MISETLNTKEFNPYYKSYIDSASNLNIVEGLKQNLDSVVSFYSAIPAQKHNFAYAEGKWTVKDILLHIIDTERIFTYRALRIARQDKTALVGFDQDEYVVSAKAGSRSLFDLIEEYKIVRQGSIALYRSFNSGDLEQIGEASGFPISVRAIGYILTGHENHHNQVIRERYL